MYSTNNHSIGPVTTDGWIRGIVKNRIDPDMEGKIGVLLTRLTTKSDPYASGEEKGSVVIDKDIVVNKDILPLLNDEATTSNIVWARPMDLNIFDVPELDTTVWIYLEDGDPNKPYYLPLDPTLNGQVVPMEFVESTSSVFDETKKPNIKVIKEMPNGTIIYYDGNEDQHHINIRFPNGTKIILNDKPNEKNILVTTFDDYRIIVDSTNKEIEASTPGGHIIRMDDIDKNIIATTGGGHTIDMNDINKNIKLNTTGGHIVNMDDSSTLITTRASSGGQIIIGNGQVNVSA